MINRELKPVSVITYQDELDAYGQSRTVEKSRRTVEMVIKTYQQQNVNDARYVDVTDIGLTKDKDIVDSNRIKDGDTVYNILYIIPSSRYYQILLKKA